MWNQWAAGGQQATAGLSSYQQQLQQGATQLQQLQQQAASLAANWQPAPGASVAATSPPFGNMRYVVSTSANDSEEFVMKLILGEYVEKGANHGKKFFQKVTSAGDQACFIYYWDNRNGPSFEGWWFGREVGGNEVWSHNANTASALPPGSGWKIPFAGAVRQTLSVTNKAEHAQKEAAASKAKAEQEKAKALTEKITPLVEKATSLLAEARKTAGDYTNLETMKAADAMLEQQVMILAAQKPNMEAIKEVRPLLLQLQSILSQLNNERGKITISRPKAMKAMKAQEEAEADNKLASSIIEKVVALINTADDTVEKAQIASEMIDACGEDLEEAKKAMSQTEAAVKVALKAVTEARVFVNQKNIEKNKLITPAVKQKTEGELKKFMSQLAENQGKLQKLANIRQDWTSRAHAKGVVKELIEKLSPVEVDVDGLEEKIEEALAGPLKGASPDKAVHEGILKDFSTIQLNLNRVTAVVESKRAYLKAPVALAEIEKVEERVRKSTSRLNKMKNDLQQVKERETTGTLHKDVGEKMKIAEDSMKSLLTLLGPYMAGVENEPFEKAMANVAESEAAASAATKHLNAARTNIRVKDVEIRRFSAAAAKQAKEQLDVFKEQLAEHTSKLTELKNTMSDRKRKVVLRELEAKIVEAEEQAQRLAQASEVFADEDAIKELSQEKVQTEATTFAEAHTKLSAAITTAQATLTKELIASKAAELGAADKFATALTKFQVRLRSASLELDKHQQLPEAVERQLKVHRALEEARAKVLPVDEKVDKVKASIDNLEGIAPEEGTEDGGEAYKVANKSVENAIADAQVALKNAGMFLQRSARAKPYAKDEVLNLQQAIVDVAAKRMDDMVQNLREREDKVKQEIFLQEAKEKVDEVDQAVGKAAEVIAKLQSEREAKDGEEGAKDESDQTPEALAEFDGAVQAALKAINGGKTFIAVKRLAAKRFTGAVRDGTLEALAAETTRLEKQSERLAELRRGNSDWKHSAAKREVSAQCEAAKAKVTAATEASEALGEAFKKLGEEADPKLLKSELQSTGKANQEADQALTEARNFLREQLRSLKSNGGANSDAMVLQDFRTRLEELSPLQAVIDKQKTLLTEQEESFVASRLQKAAFDLFEQVEAKLERARQMVEELTNNQEEDTLLASILLTQVVSSLREHMKQSSKSPEALFDEVKEKEGETFLEKCVVFQQGVQTSQSEGDKPESLSEQQLRSAFAYMCKDGDEDEKAFIHCLQARYLCMASVSLTDNLDVEGGKTLRKCDIGDIADGLEEPVLIEGKGLWRVKVKCEDGMEGYVTMSGNAGTVFFERYSEHVARQQGVEAALRQAIDAINQTFSFLKQKTEETKNARSGPLSNIRSEFTKMRVRVSKAQTTQHQLEKKVAEARTKIDGLLEAERRRTQLAADQAAADSMEIEATSKVNTVFVEAEKALKEADDLSAAASTSMHSDSSLEAIEKAEKNLEAAIASVTEVMDKVLKVHLDALTTSPKGPFVDVRKALVRHRARLDPCKSKCRRCLERLVVARREVLTNAQRAVWNVLQEHIRSTSVPPSTLFEQLAKGGEVCSIDRLRDVISKSAGSDLTATQLNLGLRDYEKAAGLSKLSFLAICQEYYKCVKDIAITPTFEVKKNTQTLRKIEVGEIVEVLDKSKGSSVGLERVRCRALLDLTEGFLTVKGNQGGLYMEPTVKPFALCEVEASFREACSSSSSEVGRAPIGSILEILEGPRREPPIEVSRLRGRAPKDSKSGWITAMDAQGQDFLQPCNLLVCRIKTALTDGFDVNQCKVLRKVDVDEMLEQLEEPREDPDRKLVRIRVKAKSDGEEGWATMKGNQGSNYLEEGNYKKCTAAVALHAKFESESRVLRTLEAGEVFQVLDERTERKEGALRARARCTSSGREGWVIVDKVLESWTPTYTCIAGTDLKDTADAEGSKVLRPIEKGEALAVLTMPVLVQTFADTGKNRFCVRVQAEKDSMVGFVHTTDESGVVLLKTAVAKR